MDFGEILERWEREGGGGREKGVQHRRATDARTSLDRWIEDHGVEDKDADDREASSSERERREVEFRRLSELRPQDSLDLHGMHAVDAGAAVEEFLRRSSRDGLEKVLIIHGKGNHSSGEPVLKKVVRTVLESSPLAGRFGAAERGDGGGGAMWVVLRTQG